MWARAGFVDVVRFMAGGLGGGFMDGGLWMEVYGYGYYNLWALVGTLI
jgi:hypothetical protein